MIEARGLGKRYGATAAVDDLTFTIRPGMVTGFLGPNGAGKTTTMRLILGLDYPSAGSVTVDGRSYAQLSAPIETHAAAELFARAPGGVGYLLKDRVADVSEFIDAITRVAQGGTVLDPEVVRHLLSAGRRGDTLAALTPREREVLSLIAQGRSNAAIAGTLFISPKVVEKHVASIFDKLGLPPSDTDNRRVIAAIRYLES